MGTIVTCCTAELHLTLVIITLNIQEYSEFPDKTFTPAALSSRLPLFYSRSKAMACKPIQSSIDPPDHPGKIVQGKFEFEKADSEQMLV